MYSYVSRVKVAYMHQMIQTYFMCALSTLDKTIKGQFFDDANIDVTCEDSDVQLDSSLEESEEASSNSRTLPDISEGNINKAKSLIKLIFRYEIQFSYLL